MESYEQEARKKGFQWIAGADEVGRGPLAGPVVAAAVMFSSPPLHLGIRDSKTLSPVQRENLLFRIFHEAASIGVGIVWVDEIDSINIHQSSLKAMREAVARLSPYPQFVLIDGLFPLDMSIPQLPIIRGDSASVSIAAASIVAKTLRDSIMTSYHNLFPQYNFIRNKGYGTKEHLSAIRKFGPCPIHRQSFKGVREY